MVFDHFLIEGRKFVLDSEDKLREVTQEMAGLVVIACCIAMLMVTILVRMKKKI